MKGDGKGLESGEGEGEEEGDTHKELDAVSTHLDMSVDKGGVSKAVDEFVQAQEHWGMYTLTYFGIEDPVVLVKSLRIDYTVKEPDSMPRTKDPDSDSYRYFIHSDGVTHTFNFPEKEAIEWLNSNKPDQSETSEKEAS